MADGSTFFKTTMTFVSDTFGLALVDKVTNFIAGISPIIQICFGIFLLLWVFHFWANGSFVDMGIDFVKKCIAWFFIIALAANADQYMKIAHILYDLDTEISGLFSGKPYDGNTLDIVVDGFNKIQEDTKAVYDKYDVLDKIAHGFNYAMQWLALKIFGGIFLIVCFASYMMHKILLVLTLLIGPLSIGLGLFPSTRNYMLNWINQCAGLILTCVMIGLVGQFQLLYLDEIKPNIDTWDISDLTLFNFSLFLGTILFSVVIWNVPALANALTGGGASAGGLHFAKGMAGGMVGAGVKGVKGARKGVGKLFGKKESSATPT